jgi:hypothetical protein
MSQSQLPPKPEQPSSDERATTLSQAHNLLMHALAKFYSVRGNMSKILPIVNGSSKISLRLIDWFVTNYSKKHNIVLVRTTRNGNCIHTNVYMSYRAQLKAYSKELFDPFRRKSRIVFRYDSVNGKTLNTTVGQLNFFRWVIENNVLDFMNAYLADIESDMLTAQHEMQRKKTQAGSSTPDDQSEASTSTAATDEAAATTSSSKAAQKRRSLAGNKTAKSAAAAGSASKNARKPAAATKARAVELTRIDASVGNRSISFD